MMDSSKFRWRDFPRAIWYFLEKDKAKSTVAFIVLFAVFFYELIPPYIVGKIVDFFVNFEKGQSLKEFYQYVGFLGVSYILVALVRLKSKNTLSIVGHHIRSRARVWGFEKLTEFSMQWHAQENTGSKIQRIYSGSHALHEISRFVRKDFLRISSTIIGVSVVFLFKGSPFIVFLILYVGIFFGLEYYFNRKIMKLSDTFNLLNQKAGGVFVEVAGNMLTLKSLGGESSARKNVRQHEEVVRDISVKKSNTGYKKWRIFQIINGLAFAVFFY